MRAVAQGRDNQPVGGGELGAEGRTPAPAEPRGRARPEISARQVRPAIFGHQRVFVDQDRILGLGVGDAGAGPGHVDRAHPGGGLAGFPPTRVQHFPEPRHPLSPRLDSARTGVPIERRGERRQSRAPARRSPPDRTESRESGSAGTADRPQHERPGIAAAAPLGSGPRARRIRAPGSRRHRRDRGWRHSRDGRDDWPPGDRWRGRCCTTGIANRSARSARAATAARSRPALAVMISGFSAAARMRAASSIARRVGAGRRRGKPARRHVIGKAGQRLGQYLARQRQIDRAFGLAGGERRARGRQRFRAAGRFSARNPI